MRPKRSARFFMIRWKIAVARNDCAMSGKNLVRRSGLGVFERFSGKKDGTLWYYRALVTAFRQHGDHADLIDEFDRVVSEIEKFVRESSYGQRI